MRIFIKLRRLTHLVPVRDTSYKASIERCALFILIFLQGLQVNRLLSSSSSSKYDILPWSALPSTYSTDTLSNADPLLRYKGHLSAFDSLILRFSI